MLLTLPRISIKYDFPTFMRRKILLQKFTQEFGFPVLGILFSFYFFSILLKEIKNARSDVEDTIEMDLTNFSRALTDPNISDPKAFEMKIR